MSDVLAVLPDAGSGLVDQFGDGLVVNYAAQFFPVPVALADLSQSQWYIAQWGQPVAINSADYTSGDPAYYDPLYGLPLYSWTEPGTNSAIAIYGNTGALGGGDVYQLTDGNTNTAPLQSGTNEADMFLSSPAANAALVYPLTLSLNARIVQSLIRFASPALSAQFATAGTVFGSFDIGLTVNFDGAHGLPAYSGYVQIVPWTSDSSAPADYYSAPLPRGASDSMQFVSSLLLPGDPALPLLPVDAGAVPATLTYNINKYVYATLQYEFSQFSAADRAVLLNLANWTFGGLYVGPATNDAQTTGPMGTGAVAAESVSIQVSDIQVTANQGTIYNPGAPPASVVSADSNPQITFYDNTLHAGGQTDGSVYSGADSGVQDRYIYTGADNISLTAPVGQNWEFGGGSGLTELTAVSGNNVFVASTGSSTMVGGSGGDVFMIPDANETGIGTWDSIENFHIGDQIRLAGLGGPGWTYSWYAALSVDGQSGLTLLATSTATPGLHELVTLVGLSMSDLASVQTTPDSSGQNALILERVVPQIQTYDLITGRAGTQPVNPGSTVGGIDAEYLYSGADSVALTAPAGTNWEFGGGSAFTDLIATSGNNVFLASTGGSNMQGGSGSDTFVIPDANGSGISVWDNIANFHTGDSLSLAGLAGAGWNYDWTGGYGTAANPALTLQATSTATPGLTERVTINGLSMTDLPKLSITHGSGADAATLMITHA